VDRKDAKHAKVFNQVLECGETEPRYGEYDAKGLSECPGNAVGDTPHVRTAERSRLPVRLRTGFPRQVQGPAADSGSQASRL